MWKSKTVWTALASLLGAVAAVATDEASLAEGLHIAITAILAIFLRHGVAKTQDAAEAAVEAASSITPAPKKKVATKV